MNFLKVGLSNVSEPDQSKMGSGRKGRRSGWKGKRRFILGMGWWKDNAEHRASCKNNAELGS